MWGGPALRDQRFHPPRRIAAPLPCECPLAPSSGEGWNADPDLPPHGPTFAPSLDELWSVQRETGQAFYLRR